MRASSARAASCSSPRATSARSAAICVCSCCWVAAIPLLSKAHLKYELEKEKLTIDQEIIERELALHKEDSVIGEYTRLTDDLLMPSEIQKPMTDDGTPLYTLKALNKDNRLEIQTFKLDIEMTRREIDLKPGMDRLSSLRSQLKWLYTERENYLRSICTCDGRTWAKVMKDLEEKIQFYR